MRLIHFEEWLIAAAMAYAKHGQVLLLWTCQVTDDGGVASILDFNQFFE